MTEHEFNKYIIRDCELVLVDAFYTAYDQYFYIPNKKTWDKFMKKLYTTDITGKPYSGGIFKETLSSKKKFKSFVKPYKKKPDLVFTTFDQFRKSIG